MPARLLDRVVVVWQVGVMPETPDLMTSEEVAAYFRVSRQTIHNWITAGTLAPAPVPGRNVRFYRDDIEKFLQQKTS